MSQAAIIQLRLFQIHLTLKWVGAMRIDGALRSDFTYHSVMPMGIPRTLLLAFLIQCLPTWAGYGPTVRTLQPYQVVSPNGTWRLDVKPGNREGAGPALTTLTNATTGEIAWKTMLPYTFWQSCVNDDGTVGGYAYTKGAMGDSDPTKDSGNFLVTFLDAKGETMHLESTHQTPSSYGMGFPIPAHRADRLLLDGANNRMIMLMPGGLFRCYSMWSGTLQYAFEPDSKGDASGYGTTDKIRFIPQTRLMLLESNSGWGGDDTTVLSCIQLIDEGGRKLWAASQHKFLRDDKESPIPRYRILDEEPAADGENDKNADPFADNDPFAGTDPFAEPEASKESAEIPEFIGPPAPQQIATFAVYFGDSEEKAVFSILEADSEHNTGDYRVVEISREKWARPKEAPNEEEEEEEATPPVDFPIATARKLTEFQLRDADGKPLSNLSAVAIGPDDQVYAIDSKSGRVHAYDRDGKFLRVCDSANGHTIETGWRSAIAVDGKGDIFARISDGYGEGEVGDDPSAGHYLHFSPNGTLNEKPLEPPSDKFTENIVFQPRVDRLLFSGFEQGVGVKSGTKYANWGEPLTQRADGQWLDYIQDVACAPDGSIAVRDTSAGDIFGGFGNNFPRVPSHLPADTITIYKADGNPIRTIDFSRYAGLTEIAFDGKHIAATFTYNPPTPLVYVFTSDGTPVGAIRIAELGEKEYVDLRPFLVSGGKAILAVDLTSGMAFRYEMP